MGGCCTNSTTLRLISNNGFHISEHGLAILFDIWNKLYYTRHIKYNWMDHLTGICFENSHSSAFAWLSWYAGNESCVPPASLSLLPLTVSRSRTTLTWTFSNSGNEAPYICLSFLEKVMMASSYTVQKFCEHFSWEPGHWLDQRPCLSFWVLDCGALVYLHSGGSCHREICFVESYVTGIERGKIGPFWILSINKRTTWGQRGKK